MKLRFLMLVLFGSSNLAHSQVGGGTTIEGLMAQNSFSDSTDYNQMSCTLADQKIVCEKDGSVFVIPVNGQFQKPNSEQVTDDFFHQGDAPQPPENQT